MAEKKFRVFLEKPDVTGAWTYFVVPFDVTKEYNENGHVKVKGTVNGIEYRTIVTPRGDGSHYMIVNKIIREQAKIQVGDEVDVVMDIDKEPRTVEIPEILNIEFKRNPLAKAYFSDLAYSHQKAFVQWILEAKKDTTIQKRAVKTVDMLLLGKTL